MLASPMVGERSPSQGQDFTKSPVKGERSVGAGEMWSGVGTLVVARGARASHQPPPRVTTRIPTPLHISPAPTEPCQVSSRIVKPTPESFPLLGRNQSRPHNHEGRTPRYSFSGVTFSEK